MKLSLKEKKLVLEYAKKGNYTPNNGEDSRF